MSFFPQFHYGVCYYPEHWHPSRHASDIARIAAAGFDLVRLGEGAWGYWEPEEGRYQFELFDNVLDLCRQHKIKAIMGTPTYCAPAWVAHKYPEVLRADYRRTPMAHGSRRNFNYTSPKYYQLSDNLCAALAGHYKAHPQIIGWQLDNEFNCHMDVSYAPSDTAAFRQWLKAKYKTLDALNAAWGAAFWSQQYTAWEQIDLPHPTPAYANPSHLLDETRFISDCVIMFAKRQAEILRQANAKWLITHNGLFSNVNGPKLVADALDFFAHDQYPLFCAEGDWSGFAQNLIQARSLSFPYAILEQQSGPGGQLEYFHRTPRAGQLRLWAFQSVAHGAKLIEYFRWRTCPYGTEQHWHGLIDQDDRDTRRLTEAAQLGRELRGLPKAFFDAPPVTHTAVMRDFDNEANDRRINTYNKSGQGEDHRWLREFSLAHLPVDIVWPTSDLASYKVLILPHFKIVDRALVAKLEAFVRDGGTLLLGAQSGLKDKNCHVVEQPLPGLFAKLAGVDITDWSTLPAGESREARCASGRRFALTTFVERVNPGRAQALAYFAGDDTLLAGAPALTVNAVGKGRVFYLAGYAPGAAIVTLIEELGPQLDWRPIVKAGPMVEAVARRAGGHLYTAILNHAPATQVVQGLGTGKDLLTNSPVKDELTLAPYAIALIQSSRR